MKLTMKGTRFEMIPEIGAAAIQSLGALKMATFSLPPEVDGTARKSEELENGTNFKVNSLSKI
jgi:hypothetical protein